VTDRAGAQIRFHTLDADRRTNITATATVGGGY